MRKQTMLAIFFCGIMPERDRTLLRGKYILMIGDSVQRGAYKDLVALLEDGTLMTDSEKIAKCERTFRNDNLIGKTEATNGTNFSEVREYLGCSSTATSGDWSNSILIRFVFATRVYNDYIKDAFKAVTYDYFPDIICVNSTFWDITRYEDKLEKDGITSFPNFEKNVKKFLQFVNERAKKAFQEKERIELPCLRIWRSALPIGRNARGGLLIPEIQFGHDSEVYRMDMGQANLNIKPIIKEELWDLLDAQFWFRRVQYKNFRENDGIHWNQIAHRWLTNIFLSHVCEAWEIEPPKYKSFSRNSLQDEMSFEEELRQVYERVIES